MLETYFRQKKRVLVWYGACPLVQSGHFTVRMGDKRRASAGDCGIDSRVVTRIESIERKNVELKKYILERFFVHFCDSNFYY